VRIVLSSAPSADADRIARALVDARVAACVTVLSHAKSTYRWKGVVEQSDEALLWIKTTDDRLAALVETLRAAHPYDVPEIVPIAANDGDVLAAYLAWATAETRPL
jgi:periplasmic divalent cation tolerance protein